MAPSYVAPFVIYLVGTALVGRFSESVYPVGYSLVAMAVAASLCVLVWGKGIVKPHWRVSWAIVFGFVGIIYWIVICHLQPEQKLGALLPDFLKPGERVAYNPFEQLGDGLRVWAFIVVRGLGLAVLVPLAEELFWRGFLLRWFIDPEWEKVQLGEYNLQSCLLVTFMFTLAHPEWLAAAGYCLLLNGLLYWKKDLWLCIVAHGVSNLVLAVYVLATGQWVLW